MKIIKKSDLTEEELEQVNDLMPCRYVDSWLENLEDFTKKINDNDEKDGLFIFGDCGTGKTHFLWAMRKNRNLGIYKLRFSKYLSELKKFKESENPYNYSEPSPPTISNYWSKVHNSTEYSAIFRKQAIDEYQKDALLNNILDSEGTFFLDDFCSEKYSEFIEECFYRILNKGWENGREFIISSNFSLKQISERVGDRIASRIAGMCQVIKLGGEDRRLKSNKI